MQSQPFIEDAEISSCGPTLIVACSHNWASRRLTNKQNSHAPDLARRRNVTSYAFLTVKLNQIPGYNIYGIWHFIPNIIPLFFLLS